MEAEAATLKSLVLAGELAEPAKSHPNIKIQSPKFGLVDIHNVHGREFFSKNVRK